MPRLSYPTGWSTDWERITERFRDHLIRLADGYRIFLFLLFGGLLFRLYTLQFIAYEHYAREAEVNVEKRIVSDPVRGRLFDRSGNLLVSNSPFFRLVIDRSWGGKGSDGISMQDCQHSIERVASLLNWDEAKKQSALEMVRSMYRGFVQERRLSPTGYVILEERLPYQDLIRIEEHRSELPGIRIEERENRKYYQGRLACHLLGYTGPISRDDYLEKKELGYRMNDWIGRDGLERAFDPILRGKRGETWQRRYANNLVENEVLEKRIPPIPGEDLFLSLDLKLQSEAENLLQGLKGGIAIVGVQTGQVLALASSPGFDLNLFRGGIRQEDYQKILMAEGKPFVDRSTGKGGGGYPPGSVFKIITSIAGIEEGIVTEQTCFSCSGSIPVGRGIKRCHQRSGHGRLNFYGGFGKSCDVYFYHVGERLGPDLLAKYARGLGLGSPTGLPTELREAAGLVPDPSWKLLYSRWGEWGRGDTLNTAIGQGFLLVTPIQIAMLTAYVANGGKLLKPQLVSHRRNGQGELTWQAQPEIRESIPVSPETIQIVREAMRWVVNESGGTGRAARLKGITVSGKTGTAEHFRKPSDAWFTCFAPFDNPEIAIAVVVEGGGHGGATSAPIARKLLEVYFRDRLSDEQLARSGNLTEREVESAPTDGD